MEAHGAPNLVVDGSTGLPEVFDTVERLFSNAIAAGPRAQTRGQRQALLREMNLADVAQVRACHRRSWAKGDPDSVVRPFVCECADPACAVDLELPVAQLADGPAMAPGHG